MSDENTSTPQDEAALRQRLELLEKKEEIVSNKETRAEIRYEIAQIRWQLGLISDEEFRQAEDFFDSFTTELGQ
jgi:hypothetical protein